jgi:hypothetical protein
MDTIEKDSTGVYLLTKLRELRLQRDSSDAF